MIISNVVDVKAVRHTDFRRLAEEIYLSGIKSVEEDTKIDHVEYDR